MHPDGVFRRSLPLPSNPMGPFGELRVAFHPSHTLRGRS